MFYCKGRTHSWSRFQEMEKYTHRRNAILGIIKVHCNILKTRPSNVCRGNINATAVGPTHVWSVQRCNHREFIILFISFPLVESNYCLVTDFGCPSNFGTGLMVFSSLISSNYIILINICNDSKLQWARILRFRQNFAHWKFPFFALRSVTASLCLVRLKLI